MKNDIKEILLTEQQIQDKVKELAAQLSKEYAGKDPVFIGVLKGVVIFFADMVRNIDIPCEIDFMSISSYSGTNLVPEYVGYTIPNEFVVGYGLDYNEHYRNLPYIGILKPEIYEK